MDISGSASGQDGPPLPADGAAHSEAGSAPESGGVPAGPARLAGYLLIYTLLRLALIAVLTAILMFFMPLIVALMFAIIVQLPLSWLLFSGPRHRVNDALAHSSAQRRSERAKLQSALSGDEPPTDR